MSTTTADLGRDRAGRAAPGVPARDRRPGWTALCVALILGLAVLGAYYYQRAGAKTPVVVVVATVPAGHRITRSDLSTVSIAGPVTAIAAGNLDEVVGQRAAVTLLAGTLLQDPMLSSAGAVPSGQAQVGLALTSGQIPSDGVQPGDIVEVLQSTGTGSSGGAPADPAQVLVPSAVVWSARSDPAHSGGMLMTITIPDDLVAEVVGASGAGQVAVVRVATAS